MCCRYIKEALTGIIKTKTMQPVEHMGPICALKVFNEKLLFSGEGPSFQIYNYVTGEKLFERIIFKRNKIHGIEFINLNEYQNNDFLDESNVKIVVWGGRSLSIFTLSELKDSSFDLPHQGIGDWIFHCMFENKDMLHILNSHNIVHTISLKGKLPILSHSRNCNWKSILYCGTLHKNSETGKVTVLAGTVMNGILIWDLETCDVKHNLTKHEGSIFNVISSPDGKYIISCSDDRSIKVWNMETGDLLANGWGHGSRIWGLSVYNIVNDGFNIFSCSEDCTSRVWSFKDDGTDELKQERIVLGHTGRHVWSVAVNDKNKIGFTGGADGKILVTDLAVTERSGYWGHKWELEDISKETKYNFVKGEMIKIYVDIGYGMLAVTSEGKIMVLKNYKTWIPLFEDSRFVRSCILKAYQKEPIVVLGNKLCDVVVIKFNKDCEVVLKKEFTLSEHFNRLGNILIHEYDNKLFTLSESPNPKDKLIYQELDPVSLEVKSVSFLTKSNDKIIISSVQYDTERNYLLIGCRFAILLIYKISNETNEPLTVYKNIFKGDTITSLLPLNDPNKCSLYLTNKDGTYHIMEINEELEYEFLQSSRIQKGFLEGIIKLPNGDILLYGFKSDSFFLWNETKQYEIMREICGGPHRRWNFKYWIENNKLDFRFVYTRSSEVQIVKLGIPYAVELLETGLHGREIRDVCAVDSVNNQDEKIIITGSEDTTLKIGTLKKNGSFELHWTYREHISGLQSIHAVNNEYIMSSSAREELYIWKINECDNKKCMSLHGLLPPSEENPDLRIMDFDSIEVFDKENEAIGFLLVCVYSNSGIKIVYYDYSSKQFTVIINDSYMKCCIFHVKFICLKNKLYILIGSTNGHIAVYDINDNINKLFKLVEENNGRPVKLEKIINFDKFEIGKLEKLIINQQMHQSAINALEIIQESTNKINLITGGDDNALIVSEICDDEEIGLRIDINSFNPSAASSTITTIKMVDNHTVLVGAVDQSVKLWDIKCDLELLEDRYTTVADIGCAEVVNFSDGGKLSLIGGAGLSIFRI